MTVSFTVNVAWPFASVVPLTVVIVELPLPAASDTALPLTAVPTLSLSVTVMVDVVEPSAADRKSVALGESVDLGGRRIIKIKMAVWVIVMPYVEYLAVEVTD